MQKGRQAVNDLLLQLKRDGRGEELKLIILYNRIKGVLIDDVDQTLIEVLYETTVDDALIITQIIEGGNTAAEVINARMELAMTGNSQPEYAPRNARLEPSVMGLLCSCRKMYVLVRADYYVYGSK